LRNSIRVNQKIKEKKNCIVNFLCVHFWAASISLGREEVNRAGIELTTEYVIIYTSSKRDDVEIKDGRRRKRERLDKHIFRPCYHFIKSVHHPKKENQANQFFCFLPEKNIIITFKK
jgi:hypothetical protein